MPTYNPGKTFHQSSPWLLIRKHPKTGKNKPHEGQDWAAPTGTAIPAAADGKVIANRVATGYGNIVVLEHYIRGKTVHTLYAHMNVPSPLSVGTKVKAGQTVGTVGMTGGVSTGPHLHFEVHPDASPGILRFHHTIDPATFDFPEGSQAESGSWSYPFPLGNGKETPHVGAYVDAMRLADDGFYPIGANSLWHGGIHFGGRTANKLAQDRGVRCISDGEVVAYRVNRGYKAIKFSPSNRQSLYSTGFVLVRHKLVLPESAAQPTGLGKLPARSEQTDSDTQSRQAEAAALSSLQLAEARKAAAPNDKAEQKKPGSETLIFYSLYMHLLDWKGYQADSKLQRPSFWLGKKSYRVDGKAAEDKQRLPPESVADPFALPVGPGTGEAAPWWAPLQSVQPPQTPGPLRDQPTAQQQIGLNVRDAPNGKLVCMLAKGAHVRISEIKQVGRGTWGKISELAEGNALPGIVDEVAGNPVGAWVYLDKMEVIFEEPNPLDNVVVLKQPFPVKAGTLLGHLGEYQRHSEAMSEPLRGLRPLLHLEVFSSGDVPGFIGRSRAYAARSPESERTLLVIEKGAKLVTVPAPDLTLAAGEVITPAADASKDGAWIKAQKLHRKAVARNTLPKAYDKASKRYADGTIFAGTFIGPNGERTQNEAVGSRYPNREVYVPIGEPFWAERARLPTSTAVTQLPVELKGWSKFPLNLASANSSPNKLVRVMARNELEAGKASGGIVTAPDGVRWWKVVTSDAIGWVREKSHPKVSWQSPWAWPGFEFVEEGDLRPLDMFAWSLHKLGKAIANEAAELKARADKVASSSLHKQVYALLDINQDDTLTPDELQRAQRNPLLARHLHHLIAKYESEWGGDMGRWDEMDPLMLDDKAEWQAEKIRIKELQWWPEVKGLRDFPSSPQAYHFHPIGLISNFVGSKAKVDLSLEEARVRAFLRMIRVGEGTVGEKGYRTMYGGGTFDSFADHPRKSITAGNWTSTAAGAYQFLSKTWDGLAKKHGYSDFSPENQDKAAVELLRQRDCLDCIKRNEIEQAIRGHSKGTGSNKEWASQPESPYGQPVMTMLQALAAYNKYLDEELKGTTSLKVPYGQLKI